MELFENANEEELFYQKPLATRMQPQTLDEVQGQKHILGPGKLLRNLIEQDKIHSLIFFGPPGCGKTALANVIARCTEANFVKLNAVIAKTEDLRQVISKAKEQKTLYLKRTILFIDELHRFNKMQQDALLPDVEEGTIILIGSTTQNPFHSVISALVSRSQVFRLEALTTKDILQVLNKALTDEKGLKNFNIKAQKDALEFLAAKANGDARKALNSLEVGVIASSSNNDKKKSQVIFSKQDAESAIQQKAIAYDENEHYDIISAFIKSMRGSDPDATIYWLAKMIYAGEDPAFIARRIVICASEDVGTADSQALVVANAAREAVEFIGMPEARIPLAHAAIYVACAPKSNACYKAIDEALEDVKNNPTQEIPDHLKNASYDGEKKLGIGQDYKYVHDYGGYTKQSYMPEPKNYYKPTNNGIEQRIKEKLDKLRKL